LKWIIVLAFILIIGSLASAMFFLIRDRGRTRNTARALGFRVGFSIALFLFIVFSNVLVIVPGFRPPTGSISTTSALALCVFVAVPAFGIASRGLRAYLASYMAPNPLMLPFNVLGEVTRTISLSIRLFGNMMSGTMITATALAIAPLFFPIVMNALGLLIGLIQAYIFSILALVFIASATRVHEEQSGKAPDTTKETIHG